MLQMDDALFWAVLKYPDEIESLKQAGVDSVFNLYTEAGTGFANNAYQET
jgi:hypothetical protein